MSRLATPTLMDCFEDIISSYIPSTSPSTSPESANLSLSYKVGSKNIPTTPSTEDLFSKNIPTTPSTEDLFSKCLLDLESALDEQEPLAAEKVYPDIEGELWIEDPSLPKNQFNLVKKWCVVIKQEFIVYSTFKNRTVETRIAINNTTKTEPCLRKGGDNVGFKISDARGVKCLNCFATSSSEIHRWAMRLATLCTFSISSKSPSRDSWADDTWEPVVIPKRRTSLSGRDRAPHRESRRRNASL